MESVEAAVAGTMSDTTLTPALAADIAALWKHPLIRECLQHSDDGTTNRLDLDDNAIFFLDRVEKMADPSFKPANEEILKVRDPTRTIETLDFQANKAKFRVIDVGGQRMERPKWNLTGEITAVIFVCSLIEYNQVCARGKPSGTAFGGKGEGRGRRWALSSSPRTRRHARVPLDPAASPPLLPPTCPVPTHVAGAPGGRQAEPSQGVAQPL